MREMTEDIVGGLSCSWCGVYFEEENGFPVACEDCWNEEKKKHPKKFKLGFPYNDLATEIHDSGVQLSLTKEI